MKSRSSLMLEKSISAMLSAIEIYNKPDFKYREETFSVLCINAWELLFKAKILQLASNKIASLFIMEFKTLKSGEKSKIKRPKINRSGNPLSVNIFEAHRIITEDYGVKTNKAVFDNLIVLTEIRDNSIHFVNDDFRLSIKIQEIGTAALQNYLHLVKEWFGDVLLGYNFYLMPISFFRDFDTATGIPLNSKEKKLLSFIKTNEKAYDDKQFDNFNLTLRIDVKFQKVKSDSGLPIHITTDPNAPAVRLMEDDIKEKYPWDYQVLTTRLSRRYDNFKINQEYHKIRKELEKDKKFAYVRLLNPDKPDSGRKVFYNANIQKEFDKHYQKAVNK